MSKHPSLFLELADKIQQQIERGVFRAGEKLPSLRRAAADYHVSLNTAIRCYLELEKRGWVTSKEKSGFTVTKDRVFVRDIPAPGNPNFMKQTMELNEAYETLFGNYSVKDGTQLSGTQLAPELVPIARLRNEIKKALLTVPNAGIHYNFYPNKKLKKQVALRSAKWGGNLNPDAIIPTAGSFESITLCMNALLKPGAVIGVESPMHFEIFYLMEVLGYQIMELPTDPITGIDIDLLEQALQKKKINALLLMGNYSNPFGTCMPETNKKAVVTLVERHNIPLIENDVWSNLYFTDEHPTFCKTYDKTGSVIWCGTAEKHLAAGYRVGWLEAGKYAERVLKSRPYHYTEHNTVCHEAIANFMETNRHDNYLKNVRQTVYNNLLNFMHVINAHFPADVKVTRPQGGVHLWIEANKNVDGMEVFNKASLNKILITPGKIFTRTSQYRNCIKLSFGVHWNSKVENSLKLLGKLIHES